MAERETETARDTVHPSPDPGVSPPPPTDATPPPRTYAEPPAYFSEALNDAERLLSYAAESGIVVDDTTRTHVLEARTASLTGWTEETAANLMTALTTLANLVKPASAASLRACCDETVFTVRSYLRIAIALAIFIVPFSIATFVCSAISNAIRADISTANDLAVKLRSQLGPPASAATLPSCSATAAAGAPPQAKEPTSAPAAGKEPNSAASAPKEPSSGPANAPAPGTAASASPPGMNADDRITELQQYASNIRSIDARARQLNVLVLGIERDPFANCRKHPEEIHTIFQLPAGLPDLALAADERTTVYQDVRYFAQNVLDDVSFFYGAISACILPVLYALLGTCAYLLRTFEQQMSARTFTPSEANSARFLIAAIGGAVVGLFNNFNITQSASIPPLAIAFLVGYAVDVFFAFLEGLIQTFSRNTASSPPTTPPAGPKPA